MISNHPGKNFRWHQLNKTTNTAAQPKNNSPHCKLVMSANVFNPTAPQAQPPQVEFEGRSNARNQKKIAQIPKASARLSGRS